MPRLFFIHWNDEEARRHARSIQDEGYEVQHHSSTQVPAKWPLGFIPDAVVISLDRLPSHGRAYAEWLLEAKKRQVIPLVFVGGAPDKVAATRAKFPKALYCSFDDLLSTLDSAIGADPPVPNHSERKASTGSTRATRRAGL
jgi:hypothetical protein